MGLKMASKRLRKAKAESEAEPRVHERLSNDLLDNAEVRPLVVDDPMEPGAKIVAFQSLRGDTLALLHAQKRIDEAQYRAGREMQRFYELSEIGGVRAIDPFKEKVDGGRIAETLTEQVQNAIQEVLRLEKALGREGTALARDILCVGLSVKQCATARNLFDERGQKWLGLRFREVLETLAFELKLITR